MADVDALASGIVTRLKTIGGLDVYNGWPDMVHPPCIVVDYAGDEPEQTMGRGELARWDFDLELFAPLAGGEANARHYLHPLIATSSTGGVFGAIAGDRTLGGVAHSCFLLRGGSKPTREYLEDGVLVLKQTRRLEVWAS